MTETFKLTKIRRRLPGETISDVAAAVADEMLRFKGTINRGDSIAIAVGSRGIANLSGIVRTIVDFVKGRGADVFIVPAMGSHGGATGEGQREVLAGYGITEERMGAPVVSSMDVVELESDGSPLRLFMDKAAHGADGVILVNRVKPHTDYHGRYESGLVKMCVVGLGKRQQASEIHARGIYGLRELLAPAAERILATGHIIGGVAIVENARDETMLVQALEAGEFLQKEPDLLRIATDNMPLLPAGDIDVLVIDRIGKDISGVGIDPNVIGRIGIRGVSDPDFPRIAAIVALDLTEASHGNALGMGLADVTTRRLYEKIDFADTYANVYTSTFLERAKIPVVAETDRKAVDFALQSARVLERGKERIMRIRDTLHLEELYVSDALLAELRERDDVEVLGEAAPPFDDEGAITPF